MDGIYFIAGIMSFVDSRKVSVGPRCSSTVPDSKGPNLSNYCQPRGSNAGNSRQSVNNRQSVSNVKVQSQGMRRRLYGNGPDPSTSVLSGISMLGQSILESNEGPEEIPIPEVRFLLCLCSLKILICHQTESLL